MNFKTSSNEIFKIISFIDLTENAIDQNNGLRPGGLSLNYYVFIVFIYSLDIELEVRILDKTFG